MGRSREIGSVSEPYAFSRPPMFLLRSAALHCARTSASGPETAYEKVQGQYLARDGALKVYEGE
jgi:hypothetical protein